MARRSASCAACQPPPLPPLPPCVASFHRCSQLAPRSLPHRHCRRGGGRARPAACLQLPWLVSPGLPLAALPLPPLRMRTPAEAHNRKDLPRLPPPAHPPCTLPSCTTFAGRRGWACSLCCAASASTPAICWRRCTRRRGASGSTRTRKWGPPSWVGGWLVVLLGLPWWWLRLAGIGAAVLVAAAVGCRRLAVLLCRVPLVLGAAACPLLCTVAHHLPSRPPST